MRASRRKPGGGCAQRLVFIIAEEHFKLIFLEFQESCMSCKTCVSIDSEGRDVCVMPV